MRQSVVESERWKVKSKLIGDLEIGSLSLNAWHWEVKTHLLYFQDLPFTNEMDIETTGILMGVIDASWSQIWCKLLKFAHFTQTHILKSSAASLPKNSTPL